jgi:flagellar biosynthetic protein FlhB
VEFFGSGSNRTEKATPKRRNEARKKGQIARSPGLAPAVVLLGLFTVLGIYGAAFVDEMAAMLRRMLSSAGSHELTIDNLQGIFVACFSDVGKSLALLAGTGLVLSVGANAAQGGLVLSGHQLGFQIDKLNPASGVKRLFGARSATELAKTLFTLGCLGYLCWSAYVESRTHIPKYVLMTPLESSFRIAGVIYRLALKSGAVLLLIAISDYFLSRRRFEKSIRMTKQEVKDEARNAEGSPEVRSRIRRRQREIALRTMMADVKTADVVITNPTHYAVALRYMPEKVAAPIVVAKGKGFVALKIREIAEANRIALVENKPLAQTLFKTVEIGQPIPSSLFKAVAEVLAYVYRLKQIRL